MDAATVTATQERAVTLSSSPLALAAQALASDEAWRNVAGPARACLRELQGAAAALQARVDVLMERATRAEAAAAAATQDERDRAEAARAAVEAQMERGREREREGRALAAAAVAELRDDVNRLVEGRLSLPAWESGVARLRAAAADDARERISATVGPLSASVDEVERAQTAAEERRRRDGVEQARALAAVGVALERLGEDVSRVRQATSRLERDTAALLDARRDDTARLDRLEEALGRKAEASDVAARTTALAATADRHDQALSNEVRPALDALSVRHRDTTTAVGALRAEVARLAEAHAAVAEEARRLRADVTARPTTRDVVTLADGKADLDETNEALAALSREVAQRAPLDLFRRHAADQALVNSSLASEAASSGRWLWLSGEMLAGGVVPLEAQATNTDPDGLAWEEGKGAVQVARAGLYQVSFAVFSQRRPEVSLLVNGAPVLAAVNSASYVTHHSSGRLGAPAGGHPDGLITGVSGIDFLALPPRSRVGLAVRAGGAKGGTGEAFLALRKLN